MTVAIYIRVSTEEQVKEGFSIGAQREMLKAYCISQGWNNYKFYVDEGISAKDTNRPQLQLLLDHIKDNIIEKVLVYRLDRMTRSVLDLHNLLKIFEDHNCAFVSSTEPYDTSTAVGRLFITLVAAMAQWERENTGERIKMVLDEKAKKGEWLAQAPFGFKKINKVLHHDDEQMPILKDMINKTKEGYSMRQLANYLNDSGTPPMRGYQWHITTIQDILKNPALYGAMRWKDNIYENRHEGIMTKEEHQYLLKILSDRQNKKKRNVNSFFIYQMKLICPTCGNHLTSERYKYTRKTDGVLTQHNRYRCQVCALARRKAISCSEKAIDEAFVTFMKKLQFDSVPEPEQKEQPSSLLKSKIRRVEKQREKYQRAWVNELMTDDEFTERMNETKKLIDLWKEELSEVQTDYENHFDQESLKEIVNDFNENWLHLKPKEKHSFLSMFIEGIKFNKNGKEVNVVDTLFY
ncbi:recombinase family protein [Virgibacillus halodenitrificans]|nr:recombinase family protein [Virgibacillus halodenitrificans]